MISIFITNTELNNIDKWAGIIVHECFEAKTLSNELKIFTFFDDSNRIDNSSLVKKFWAVKKQNKGFLEVILKSPDFPVDELKELAGNEYETGDFMGYFEFSLAEIFYRYLKKQTEIIMHISSDDEMYE